VAGKKKLTARQTKFIEGVLSGLSQAEAYRRAGYKCDRLAPPRVTDEAHRLSLKKRRL
jgi:hypothetical protein